MTDRLAPELMNSETSQLMQSEARFRAAMEAVQGILWTNDADGQMRGEQPNWAALTGQSQQEYEGYGWSDAVHPEDAAATVEAWNTAVAEKRVFVFEHRLRRCDGVWRRFSIRAVPIFDADGSITEWVGVHTDVTEQREAEAALQESEEKLRLATDAAEVGLWDWGLTDDTMFWPPRVRAMFGISPDAPVTMDDFYNGVHPDDVEYTTAAFAAAMDPDVRASYDVEYRAIGKEDGVTRWVAAKGKAQFDARGRCLRILGTAIDITERKRIEEQLRNLNATLEARVAERTQERDRTWNNARDLLAVGNTEGIFRAVNPAWTEILGWTPEELVDRYYLEFIHPDDQPSSEVAHGMARQNVLPTYVNRMRHKDGSYRWISWVSAPEENLIYASGRDITAEKARDEELAAAREALRQSQKMEAMGQLTGGVAHDFNNLLTPIVGTLDMLRRRNLGGEREQMLIDGAMQSAERAKMLVQRLLAFARRQPLQPTPVDVGALVSGMAELLSSTTGPQVKVVVEIADELPLALADANQLEMALLNLGVNARDAMPDGGTLRITAMAEAVDWDPNLDVVAGNYIRLSVADTGIGMDEETISRSVEPFFSTKGIGKGTGLGLSMVHGLAQQLGGRMVVRSKQGIGTNIELWLPVTDTIISKPADGAQMAVTASFVGTALLVDDEDLVRMSTADLLSELGYHVIEATSAEQALNLIRQGLQIDILISDHLMPGMGGTELARCIQSEVPGVAVLIISGYADAAGIAADLPRLNKPFRKDELAAALANGK